MLTENENTVAVDGPSLHKLAPSGGSGVLIKKSPGMFVAIDILSEKSTLDL